MKSTKKALLLSVLSLVLCCSMLFGTTYAWFTDSVTSGVNTIKAGNLDIELEYSKDGTTWETVQGATELFKDVTLWEPGATSVVYLKLTNKGTLALKYNLAITATGGDFTNAAGESKNLKDALKFAQVAGSSLTTYATREAAVAATASTAIGLADYAQANHMAANDVSYITLVVTMPTTVGNEFNYKTGTPAPTIDLRIELKATQYTAEKDSFDKKYDENLFLAGDEFASKVAAAATDGTVTEIWLENDIALTNKVTVPAGAKIVVHGNGNQITSNGKLFEVIGNNTTDVFADITIDGVDFVGNGYSGNYAVCVGKHFAGKITVENCTFDNMMCGVMVDDGGNGASTITLKNNDFSGALWSYSLQKDNAARTVTYAEQGNIDGILGEKELFGEAAKSATKVSTLAKLNEAIANANEDAKIFVMPGTYTGNVTFPNGKTGLTIIGAGVDETVIKGLIILPANVNGYTYTIKGLTVDGNGAEKIINNQNNNSNAPVSNITVNIENAKIMNAGKYGVAFDMRLTGSTLNLKNVTFENCGDAAISVKTKNNANDTEGTGNAYAAEDCTLVNTEYAVQTFYPIYYYEDFTGTNPVIKVTPNNVATMSFADEGTYKFVGEFNGSYTINVSTTLNGAPDKTMVFDGTNATFDGHLTFVLGNERNNYNQVVTDGNLNGRHGDFTIKGFKSESSISVITYSCNALKILNNTVQAIDLEADNTVIVVDGNTIDCKLATAIPRFDGGNSNYGFYLYAFGYDLTFTNNSITNAYGHSFAINGAQALSNFPQTDAEAPVNKITAITGNTINVVDGSKDGDRVAFKIWDDATYASTHAQTVRNDAVTAVMQSIKDGNNTVTLAKGTNHWFSIYNSGDCN